MPNLFSSSLPREIALVHEWFTPRSVGGAEKVVQKIDHLFSKSGLRPNLISLVDGESALASSWLYKRSIQTSFIQHLPFGINNVQSYLPLLPFAIEQLDLSEYPLVISSSHLVAKGVLTSPDQLHLSYIHTPVRYAWDQMFVYLRNSSLAKLGLGPLIRLQLHYLRQWDQLSAARVDCLLANSRFTARRIASYWRRSAEVIHPPVEVDRFSWTKQRDDFYLCLCRLVPNKRVDLVVKAFNKLGLPLVVVGVGPQENYLKRIAASNITFMGFQKEENVENLMSRCRAFVYAGIEDFGISPVEAMASGAPVIALGKGGVLDTVRCATKGLYQANGILFNEAKAVSLYEAVNWFEEQRLWQKFSKEVIRTWAEKFRPEAFEKRFSNAVCNAWTEHQKGLDFESVDPIVFPEHDFQIE